MFLLHLFRWKTMSKITARSSVLWLLFEIFFASNRNFVAMNWEFVSPRYCGTYFVHFFYRVVKVNQSKCYLDFFSWTFFPSGPSRTKLSRSGSPCDRSLIVQFFFSNFILITVGVANGKIETLRDGETSVFLCETETFPLFKLRDREI